MDSKHIEAMQAAYDLLFFLGYYVEAARLKQAIDELTD
jgi:hypothetical protein